MRIKLDKADKEFSKFIKVRDDWTCQRCGKKFLPENARGLDCSHYWGRRRESTRFEPDNCDALCTGCHFVWGGDGRAEYTRFKKRQLGESRYASLMIQAHQYRKKDREMEYIRIKSLMVELEARKCQ